LGSSGESLFFLDLDENSSRKLLTFEYTDESTNFAGAMAGIGLEASIKAVSYSF
jgi:hypothetical protein